MSDTTRPGADAWRPPGDVTADRTPPAVPPVTPPQPPPPGVSGAPWGPTANAAPAPPGWWLASDGRWYPPQNGGTVPYSYGYTAPVKTNGMAIAAMVLGILWLYWIGSILALVFGYISRRQIDESNGTQGGRGMAIAGIVLGWVGVGIFCVFFVFGLLAALGSSA